MNTIIERPGKSREAILVYGRESSGKSWQVFNIARHTAGSRFYVIDNDDAPSYELGLETGYVDLANRFEVAEIDRSDWEAHLACIERFIDQAVRDADDRGEDVTNYWLVVDSASPMYDMSQEWYTEQVFGKTMADFFMDARLKVEKSRGGDTKKLETFDGWKDWTVIKAQYRRWQSAVRRWPGHVYMTCETKAISDLDDKTVKKLYAAMGAKPAGDKNIGHTTRTVMLFEKSGREWTMTTVKDRYRDILEDEPLTNFALDYLRDVGGWREVDPPKMSRAEKLAALKGGK